MSVQARHYLRADPGLAAGILSAAAFGTSGTFGTSLLRAGWTPGAAVAVRLVIAAVALTVPGLYVLRTSGATLLQGWRTVVTYGLVPVAGCQLCYFEAIQHLSVAVALLLEYSGAVLVVGWMWARHHQIPSRMTATGAGVAILGLVLVLDLAGHHHLSPIGLLWGTGSAVGLAVYFVISSQRSDDELPPLVVAWGGLSVGALAMVLAALAGVLPLRAPRTSVVLAHTHVSWIVPILGIGLVAAAFAYVAGIVAARSLGARLASFVGLAEVLCAAIYAWLLLGQRLGPVQLIGAALMVGGIALVRLGENIEPEQAVPAIPADRVVAAVEQPEWSRASSF